MGRFRFSTLTDLIAIKLLLNEHGKYLRYRSDEHLTKLIKSKHSFVYQSENGTIAGYGEQISLTPGDGSCTVEDVRIICREEIRREFHCRDGDLIIIGCAIVSSPDIRGKTFILGVSQWLRHLVYNDIKQKLTSGSRVIYMHRHASKARESIRKITDFFMSLFLEDGTPVHKMFLPCTIMDNNGRKGFAGIYYVDPPIPCIQREIRFLKSGLFTEAERRRLINSRIGFLGLSTKLTHVALEICLREGIGGVYLLADMDHFTPYHTKYLPIDNCDIGKSLVDLCAIRIHNFDPLIKTVKYNEGFNESNAEKFVSSCDIIVDGCNDFSTKLLIRQVAKKLQIPLLHLSQEDRRLEILRYDIDDNCHPFLSNIITTSLIPEESNRTNKVVLVQRHKSLINVPNHEIRLSNRIIKAIHNSNMERTLFYTNHELEKDVKFAGTIAANFVRCIHLGSNDIVTGQYSFSTSTDSTDFLHINPCSRY